MLLYGCRWFVMIAVTCIMLASVGCIYTQSAGDVIIERVATYHPDSLLNTEDTDDHRSRRAVTADSQLTWPDATIPYLLMGYGITKAMRYHIERAMSHWEKHTCIRFIKRTNETDYILIGPGACGCCSFVGRRSGKQIVNLSASCAWYGVIIHELGHVLGFWHEHSRPDRDAFIEIHMKNIDKNRRVNFDGKLASEIDSLGVPYDYKSIMHYRKNTFSKNGKDTMQPKLKGVFIGQRETLSQGDILQANLLYECPKRTCDGIISDTQGFIQSPNYPLPYYTDHNCTWIIVGSADDTIELEIIDISIDGDTECKKDYLEVRNGNDGSGDLIGRLCGYGEAGTFKSSAPMWIRFHSDESITNRGFKARYWKPDEQSSGYIETASGDIMDQSGDVSHPIIIESSPTYFAACNKRMTSSSGSLQSPLLPVDYNGAAVTCVWSILGDMNVSAVWIRIIPKSSVHDRMKSLQCIGDIYSLQPPSILALNHSEAHDKLNNTVQQLQTPRLDDAYEYAYQLINYDCSQSLDIKIQTSAISIHWNSIQHRKIYLKFIMDYDECVLDRHECAHACRNTIDGYKCTCTSGYQLATDGKQCVPKRQQLADRCGMTLHGERGKLRAGTEPLRDCRFYIIPPPGHRVILTFTKFLLLSSAHNNSCISYVEVLGKKGVSKGMYCGANSPGTFTSLYGLVVRLHSDELATQQHNYFTAQYFTNKVNSSDRCDTHLYVTSTQLLRHREWPSPYSASEMCVWHVTGAEGHVLLVTFTQLSVEYTRSCVFDFIEFRNGRHKTSPLIGRFCGSITPPTFRTRTNQLFVMFVSDSSGNGSGFQMTVKAIKADQPQ